MKGRAGFSLVEVMVLAVVLGLGLGGLGSLLAAALRLEGEAARQMRARVMAQSALEQGAAVPDQGPLRMSWQAGAARVAWREGDRVRELRLQRWAGP